ncbi:MAG: nucleoid-associated protein [Clostridiales bacterium]|jgi:hypothetical protein|nr:nucleoid-associated protein [Clostridiales bacterium]
MELKIKNAILHSLDNSGASVLSERELDIDSEACQDFIGKHVKKLLGNPAAKEAVFHTSSEIHAVIRDWIEGAKFFKDACAPIGRRLCDLMEKYPAIPAGDLLIVSFHLKRENYLAILKLNYREYFTHQLTNSDAGADNQLVKYSAALPYDSGKVEEACLIPFDPMLIKVIEKPFELDGEQKNYFSELFLECDPALSKKEAAQILHDVTEEINEKYFDGGVDVPVKIKTALIGEAEEAEGEIRLENVASKVFEDNLEIREAYLGLAREAGFRSDIFLGEKYVRQQFGAQKLKAENGVELKFPASLWNESESIEFVHQPDGSRAILLKNLGKIALK